MQAVRTSATPEVSAMDGLLATTIGVAAHRSIEEGRPIELTELLSDEMLTSVREDRKRARARDPNDSSLRAQRDTQAELRRGAML